MNRPPAEENPADADALHRAGLAAFAAGDGATARARLEEAAAAAPERADIVADLGVVLRGTGEIEAAATHLRRAVELDPDAAGHHYNLALVLADLGRAEEAEAAYRRAAELDPGHPAPHNNLGNLLKARGLFDEAAAAYERAIAADGTYAPAHRNLADLLEGRGDAEGAAAVYTAAIRLRPDAGTRIRDALLLPVIAADADEMARYRARLEERLGALADDGALALADPVREVGATNFMLAYQGADDRPIQEALAQIYLRACPDLAFTAPHVAAGPSGERIRIGFVSAFFRDHTIQRLNLGLIRGLPREAFEVHVFAIGGAAGTEEAAAAADAFTVLPVDPAKARAALAAARLDVLYYTDVGMEPVSYFLAFARLARVQCVTWGHPVTTGIPNIDYFVSSELAEPAGAEAHYSERLVRLDGFSTSVAMPDAEAARLPAGLGDARYAVCAQSLFKLHPDFDRVLGRVLAEKPAVELVLIEGRHAEWSARLRARFERTLPSGAAARVRFVPRLGREAFLGLLKGAAVALDSWPFGGGMTTYESLAMGTPVVTWPADRLSGRLSLGLYRQMGFTELVAGDGDEMADLAGRLLGDADFAAHARARIAAGREAIFARPEPIAEHARFFAEALKSNGPPRSGAALSASRRITSSGYG